MWFWGEIFSVPYQRQAHWKELTNSGFHSNQTKAVSYMHFNWWVFPTTSLKEGLDSVNFLWISKMKIFCRTLECCYWSMWVYNKILVVSSETSFGSCQTYGTKYSRVDQIKFVEDSP